MLNSINVKYWELAHSSEDLGYYKEDDYNARCDVCGDSKKRKNLKRLHLYRKPSYDDDSVKCHNCGETFTMYSYLRDHHPALLPSYAQEMGMTKLDNLQSVPRILNIQEVKKTNTLFTFNKPPEFNNPTAEVGKYLKSRGFSKDILNEKLKGDFKVYISNGTIQLLDKTVSLKNYIIIPLLENGKWYGFYSRSLDTKTFYTYLPPQNTGYKLWNYFTVNKKDTVYIFEAIFNALSTSLPGIACLGSDIDEDKLKTLSKPVFVFDNDETGVLKSLKYAEKGHKIFIWPSEIKQKDVNDLLRDGWTVEQIDKFITDNIFEGITAIIRLKMKQ